MIRNESEIRVAVLAILVGVLALNGFAGCAIMVLIVLIPWKPFLVVSSYLAQPVVDWRVRKACERQEKGLMQIEQELESFLGGVKQNVGAPVSAFGAFALAGRGSGYSPYAFARRGPATLEGL